LAASLAACVPLVVGLVRLFYKHRLCREPLEAELQRDEEEFDGSFDINYEGQPLLPPSVEKKFNPRLNKSLMGTDDLELIKPIGKGSFGEVYVGKWSVFFAFSLRFPSCLC